MRRVRRATRPWEWTLAVVISLTVGVLIVKGRDITPWLPAGGLAFLLAGLSFFVFVRSLAICRASLRMGGGFSHLGSAIFGVGILLAIVLPGSQLLAGVRQSRIESLGFPTPNPAPDLALAFLLYILALGGFYLGETLVSGGETLRNREFGTTLRRTIGRTWESKITYWVLMLIGIPLVLFFGTDFEDRGRTAGKGLQQLFGYAPPIAIAVAVLNVHWGSRRYVAFSLLTLAIIIPGGIRTPLIIVGAAVAMRYLRSTAHRPFTWRQVLVGAVTVYFCATMLVALSTYRGSRNDPDAASLPANVLAAAENPFFRLQEQGVDTVDGLILAMKVDPDYVGASWTDPTKIVTGFIPHQIWEDKPPWLSATVSQTYTSFPAGAIFLSGPGYTLIVFRTIVAVPLLFIALGAFSEALFWRMRQPSVWSALLAYFLVRFFFEGDAFSAFHVIGLCIVLIFARTATGLIQLLHRPREPADPVPFSGPAAGRAAAGAS